MTRLHVTNGDCATALLRRAGFGGALLPWRDVLHEGPVPWGMGLGRLSRVRAHFIAQCGWGEETRVARDFRERDRTLAAWRRHGEIVLWFEHDLYDQLQLLQILDWCRRRGVAVALAQSRYYLGRMTPLQLRRLFASRRPVDERQLNLAARAWRAFRAPTPQPWAALLARDLSPLPHLRAAVLRHLEELPAPGSGLARSERQILAALEAGPLSLGRLFGATQRMESAIFMGDSVFWLRLEVMMSRPAPLLRVRRGTYHRLAADGGHSRYVAQEVSLTPLGRDVLHGRRDWLERHPIDRWVGGTHLQSANLWRWDPHRRILGRDPPS